MRKIIFFIALVFADIALVNASQELLTEKDRYLDSIAKKYNTECPDQSKSCLFRINMENAISGNRIAMWFVGSQYKRGVGIKENLREAHVWYEKSANEGYYLAQVEAAINYGQGFGVAVDLEKYSYWLEKAALQDLMPEPQLWLGIAYIYGSGVAVNDTKAMYWLKRSLNFSNAAPTWRAEALYYIGRLIESGRAKPNKSEAFEYFEEAARLGHKEAEQWANRLNEK